MPVLNAGQISDALKAEIGRSIEMHTFVVRNVPDSFAGDTDEKMLVGSYFSLILEHHGAILHLLQTGQFDGSALGVTTPKVKNRTLAPGYRAGQTARKACVRI